MSNKRLIVLQLGWITLQPVWTCVQNDARSTIAIGAYIIFANSITATPHCGEFLLEPTGEIKSPGLKHNIPYLANSDCVWKISTDINRTIARGLVDNKFDIENGTSIYSCNRDYLTVYDGENDQARRMGSFCGNAFGMRAFRTLYSSGRHLYLKFKSDGKNQRKGFHLRYSTFLKGQVVL